MSIFPSYLLTTHNSHTYTIKISATFQPLSIIRLTQSKSASLLNTLIMKSLSLFNVLVLATLVLYISAVSSSPTPVRVLNPVDATMEEFKIVKESYTKLAKNQEKQGDDIVEIGEDVQEIKTDIQGLKTKQDDQTQNFKDLEHKIDSLGDKLKEYLEGFPAWFTEAR